MRLPESPVDLLEAMEARVATLEEAIFARTCVLVPSEMTRSRVGSRTWWLEGVRPLQYLLPLATCTGQTSVEKGGRGTRGAEEGRVLQAVSHTTEIEASRSSPGCSRKLSPSKGGASERPDPPRREFGPCARKVKRMVPGGRRVGLGGGDPRHATWHVVECQRDRIFQEHGRTYLGQGRGKGGADMQAGGWEAGTWTGERQVRRHP